MNVKQTLTGIAFIACTLALWATAHYVGSQALRKINQSSVSRIEHIYNQAGF